VAPGLVGAELRTFLLVHEVLAFVAGRRQRLHGLPGALGVQLEGATVDALLRLAVHDASGAGAAARTAAIALQAAVALGALTEAEAAAPRARLRSLRRTLAARARAA
jgi:hypothetical protein